MGELLTFTAVKNQHIKCVLHFGRCGVDLTLTNPFPYNRDIGLASNPDGKLCQYKKRHAARWQTKRSFATSAPTRGDLMKRSSIAGPRARAEDAISGGEKVWVVKGRSEADFGAAIAELMRGQGAKDRDLFVCVQQRQS